MQILAREITEALSILAQPFVGQEVTRELSYQGVYFGKVKFRKDGSLDPGDLRTIDPDLVVPAQTTFFWDATGTVQTDGVQCGVNPGQPSFH